MIKITSDEEFLMVARNFYNNHEGNTENEFQKDLKIFNSLRNQIAKYHRGSKNVREIVNFYIILSNLFSLAIDVMLRYKIPQMYHPYIAVFPKIFRGKTEDPNCFSNELYNDIMELI